jgi:hypothetical protein
MFTKKSIRRFLSSANPRTGKNMLNLPDSDILTLYKNTKLNNSDFCNIVTKLSTRSARSIRAFLVVNAIYIRGN